MKIDLEKFICSLMEQGLQYNPFSKNNILQALADQGLAYKEGKIVATEPEPFKVVKGNWYRCIRTKYSVTDKPIYKEGKYYKSEENGHITSEALLNLNRKDDAHLYFVPAPEPSSGKPQFVGTLDISKQPETIHFTSPKKQKSLSQLFSDIKSDFEALSSEIKCFIKLKENKK